MQDLQGLELRGSAEAVHAYDRAVDHLIRFQIEVIDEVKASIQADPNFVMGRIFSAYLSLLSTEGAEVRRARDVLAATTPAVRGGDEADLPPRERAHLEAANRWAAGDMLQAGRLLDALSVEFPRDLLALAVGHQIDFLTGNATNLRDRIGRAIGSWDPADPRFGYVQGMYAFGLEECNLYGLSDEVGHRAVQAHPDDVWGVHAVVHTYEMQGRIADGVRFMQVREGDWAHDNYLNVHNSWHYALYLLQGLDVDSALEVYDRVLHHDDSEDVAYDLLDATSLLWRLHLDGTPVGDRWRPLSEAWARLLIPRFYPFNDMHAIMAFVGAGDFDRARELLKTLKEQVDHDDQNSTGWVMTSTVGLPVCRSLMRFADGDYGGMIDEFWPVRLRLHHFGGSHAQRDAMERTLLESAIRAARTDLALALVNERLGLRERSSYSWGKRAEALGATADRGAAEAAAARASQLAAEIHAAASG